MMCVGSHIISILQTRRTMRPPDVDRTDDRWQKAAKRGTKTSSAGWESATGRVPKTTAKTLQYQQYTAQRLKDRREQEELRKLELLSYQRAENLDPETKERVQNSLPKKTSQDRYSVSYFSSVLIVVVHLPAVVCRV